MTRYVACYFLLSILIGPVCLEPLLIGEYETYIVQEGSSLELKCKFGPGSEFHFPVADTYSHVTSDHNITDDVVFHRLDTIHGDTGWYGCAPKGIIVHPDDHQQPSTSWSYVYVKSEENLFAESPIIWILSSVAGETVVIPCRPTSPDYPVKLSKGSREMKLGGDLSFDPRVGFIWKNIKIIDSNVYTCAVEHNNTKQEIVARIMIEEKNLMSRTLIMTLFSTLLRRNP